MTIDPSKDPFEIGLSIFGIIRARADALYPATLLIRLYFLACIIAFYAMTRDPLFLVLLVIVGLGFVLTLSSYLYDRNARTPASV